MKKVLFIGNSYTDYNDMPRQIFAAKAAAAGLAVEVTAVTGGGWTLSEFADPEDEVGCCLRDVVEGQHYDYVVLQEQSCRPVEDPEKFFDGIAGVKTCCPNRQIGFSSMPPGAGSRETRSCRSWGSPVKR